MHKTIKKVRSLVYVPNKFCNLGCRYCYLGTSTNIKEDTSVATMELRRITDKLLEDGVVVDQFILHGAEITAMNPVHLEELFKYMHSYRDTHLSVIRTLGSGKNLIHIKTNLFNFDKLQYMLDKYAVSVSGSFDLPFKSHEKYRVSKTGKSTLDKILNNIKILKTYKYGKQLSCVVTKEVFDNRIEFVKDLKYMHEVIGFDMINEFYIMFSYDSQAAISKFDGNVDNATMLSQVELVEFYNFLKAEFKDTPYMNGIKYNWFKEFLPEYCTFRHNCHESLLIQKNGDVYPCHRAQPREDFKFGNIHTDGYAKILDNGYKIIKEKENENNISKDCLNCGYFSYCYTNCTLVRNETKMDRSYTCSLQKELYKDSPERFPNMKDSAKNDNIRTDFLLENNLNTYTTQDFNIPAITTPELEQRNNSLQHIIANDDILNKMYMLGAVRIVIDGEIIDMASIKAYNLTPEIIDISEDSIIQIGILKEYFNINCDDRDIDNNNLMMIMIRDTKVVYGHEQRTKQEHIFNQDIYYNSVVDNSTTLGDYYIYDISHIIHAHKNLYLKDVFNSLFITTKEARKYHYYTQANNAFYHIQAINLPFHKFNFNYIKD